MAKSAFSGGSAGSGGGGGGGKGWGGLNIPSPDLSFIDGIVDNIIGIGTGLGNTINGAFGGGSSSSGGYGSSYGGGSAGSKDDAERARLKGLLGGYSPDSIIADLLARVDRVANQRIDSRRNQFNDQINDLTSTFQGAIPQIENSFSSMGIGNSTYTGDKIDDTNSAYQKSVKQAKTAYDEDLGTIGNWRAQQQGTANENANRIRRGIDASNRTDDLYSLRSNDSEIANALGQLTASRDGMVEGSDAVSALNGVGNTSAFDAARSALESVIGSSIPTSSKEAAREALGQGLNDPERKKLNELQINKSYGQSVA